MRRIAVILTTMTLTLALAVPASAQNIKFSFEDVMLPDGQTGEIEAGVKLLKNKSDSVTCTYFTDDYADSLGYSFTFVEPAPTTAEAVLEFCLAHFDERHT